MIGAPNPNQSRNLRLDAAYRSSERLEDLRIMRRLEYYLAIGLITGLIVFGLTSSLEVFYPAYFLSEESPSHIHSGNATFCGSVVNAPDLHCIHSATMLDVYADQAIESGDYFENIRLHHNPLILTSDFELYDLRAPPRQV